MNGIHQGNWEKVDTVNVLCLYKGWVIVKKGNTTCTTCTHQGNWGKGNTRAIRKRVPQRYVNFRSVQK